MFSSIISENYSATFKLFLNSIAVILFTSIFNSYSPAITQTDTLRVPGYTAYSEPDPGAIRFSERTGITRWISSENKVVWYGNIKNTGTLTVAISLKLPESAVSKFRLTTANQSLEAQATGAGDQSIIMNFGSVNITKTDYYSFTLEGLSKTDSEFGNIDALILSGSAVKDAHFNLVSRRNAASVHLRYPIPDSIQAEYFYNEVTVRTEPLWSYYMACGFRRGYFGIQVNSPTERRIIFSVWDAGSEPTDRSKVDPENLAQLIAKGENVVTNPFGGEGTGGHSHLIYNWKAGETYRFLVTAKPESTYTIYTGYFYFPEKQEWGLIASFKAPRDGGWLRGLYSFNENFSGANGQFRRLAEFGSQWIKTADGKWIELTIAQFTTDATGRKDRFDFGAGIINNTFYLSNGGFVANPIKYGDQIIRPVTNKQPKDIKLPVIK
jgi:hypothetical protein